MPCYDSRDSHDSSYVEAIQARDKTTAMLCAVLRAVEAAGGSVPFINEKESGVTNAALHAWWKQHKADDELRRERERQQKIIEARALVEKLRPVMEHLSASDIRALFDTVLPKE